MSNYEPKPGTGAIFRNKYKVDGDNQPTYKGSFIDLGGHKLDIALWVKKSQSGESYFSVNISVPYEKPEAQRPPQSEAAKEQPSEPDPGNNLPF